jgi:hypothetical protein
MGASKIRELLVARAHEIADELEKMMAPHERKRARRGLHLVAPANDLDESEAERLLEQAGWAPRRRSKVK